MCFTPRNLLKNICISKVILGETLPPPWVKLSPFKPKTRVKLSPLPLISTYSVPCSWHFEAVDNFRREHQAARFARGNMDFGLAASDPFLNMERG